MSGDSNPVSEIPLEVQGDPGQGEGQGPEDCAGGPQVSGDADPGASQAPGPEVDDGAGAAEPAARHEAEFAALQEEHESLRSQYMRIAADFDNFRKRQSRDRDDLRLQITCSTVSEILPVVDNFERARQQLNPQHEEAQSLHGSYQGLYRQLVEVLKQLGVASMRVEGEPFDPNLHEAVMREPSEHHPEDVVIEELQRGYQLNGRVLRHALVKVSMGPGPSGAGPAPEPGPEPEQDG
jgi:molecular chaperone GrpE